MVTDLVEVWGSGIQKPWESDQGEIPGREPGRRKCSETLKPLRLTQGPFERPPSSAPASHNLIGVIRADHGVYLNI